MSEFVVRGVPGSPYLRAALLGLEEKHADYRLAALAMGEAKTPAHLARQPFGRVPTFEHDDFQLYETQAILRYLDAVLPQSPLQPAEPKARARMDQIIGIVDWYVMPFVTVGISAERIMSKLFWGREPDEAKIGAALPNARVCVRELERLKDGAPFLAGDQLSIADLMLVPQLDFFAATPEGRDLLEGTSLLGWLEKMQARDSFQATTVERLAEAAV
jgi:glutathione S-transferase